MWREACERGRSLNFKMVSGSMSPMIEVGNTVKVSRMEPSEIRIGDLVAFQDGQNVAVHCVIGKSWSNQQLSFRHRGNAGGLSGEITSQNLIGKVLVIDKEGHQIGFDSRRYIVSNRILGWRLRLADILGRMRLGLLRIALHQVLRLPWNLCRGLLLCHF
jgi:hypothetical protein